MNNDFKDEVVVEEGIFNNSLFVKHNRLLHKIEFSNIHWIESDGNYSTIITEGKKYLIRRSLTKLMDNLPGGMFLRINKSCIVQSEMITQIDPTNNTIYLGDNQFPLGRNYKRPILDKLNVL